jgi:dihydroorotase/N-acyl-D-amino-acid deacylase
MKIFRLLLFATFLTSCSTTTTGPSPSQPQAEFDLMVTNARIIDGTGAPWFRGDVGIRGDSIAAIGDLAGRAARVTIDAQGHVLAPGFIDLLGWDETSVLIDPNLEGKIRQGITTEITGEGHSPAPLSESMLRDRNSENPARQVTWLTLGDYMKAVEARGSAVNFGFLVGASNPRSMVIGPFNRQPTVAEMEQMEAIVDQAMRDGAVGLSSSLIYIPAIYSTTEELIAFAKIAAKYGGVYFSHIRDEDDDIGPALDEAFRIGREASIPVNIWHLKVTKPHNWGRMPEIVAKIEEARRSGVDVAANAYPYTASSTGLTTRVPDWALEGGYTAFLERLKDPQTRLKIATEIGTNMQQLGGPDRILVNRIPNPDLARYEKKRLGEIATMMNADPVEAMLRIFEGSKYVPSGIFFSMSEDDLRLALRQPWVSIGSDAGAVVGKQTSSGAHPRAYGTFPRVLGHYVRDVKLFPLEEAVRKVTSQAAARANLFDRGLIRGGMKADLVIFDPDIIRDVSTYEDPHHFSEGISDVIVNGVPVLRGGMMTGALPGRVLRGRGSTNAEFGIQNSEWQVDLALTSGH